jgi:hypothetical protein
MVVRLSALYTCRLLPPRKIPGTYFCYSLSQTQSRVIVWLEELGQLKNQVISLGLEPLTFWLVAYCLNQLHYHVPQQYQWKQQLLNNA